MEEIAAKNSGVLERMPGLKASGVVLTCPLYWKDLPVGGFDLVCLSSARDGPLWGGICRFF